MMCVYIVCVCVCVCGGVITRSGTNCGEPVGCKVQM